MSLSQNRILNSYSWINKFAFNNFQLFSNFIILSNSPRMTDPFHQNENNYFPLFQNVCNSFCHDKKKIQNFFLINFLSLFHPCQLLLSICIQQTQDHTFWIIFIPPTFSSSSSWSPKKKSSWVTFVVTCRIIFKNFTILLLLKKKKYIQVIFRDMIKIC